MSTTDLVSNILTRKAGNAREEDSKEAHVGSKGEEGVDG